MRNIVHASIALIFLVGSAESVAHHSANLDYDLDANVTISGEFVDMRWINPHAIIRLHVMNERGEVELWAAETHGSSILARFGWRPDMFEPSEHLSLYGNPSRRKDHRAINLLSVTTKDGKTYETQRPN